MYFIDALTIINLCVEQDILSTHDGMVIVQHENGPVLWDRTLLAQELMHDEEGQTALLGALKEKGVEHKQFDFTSIDNAIAFLERKSNANTEGEQMQRAKNVARASQENNRLGKYRVSADGGLTWTEQFLTLTLPMDYLE